MALVRHIEARATDATKQRFPLSGIEAYADLAALRQQEHVHLEVVQRCCYVSRERPLMPLQLVEATLVPADVVKRNDAGRLLETIRLISTFRRRDRLTNTARRHIRRNTTARIEGRQETTLWEVRVEL